MARRLLFSLVAVLLWLQVAVAQQCCRGEYADNGLCKLCPENTYQPTFGAMNVTSCFNCSSANFPDGAGKSRPFSWAGNADVLRCHQACGHNEYWTYPCGAPCWSCPCAAPAPVKCSPNVGPMGGCVPVGACFAEAQCDPSPCAITNTSNGARYISFTDTSRSYDITFPCPITLQVLVVAGGGAGGPASPNPGGGGGAGGLGFGNLTFTANAPYTVQVGIGGASVGPTASGISISGQTLVTVTPGGRGAGYYIPARGGGSGGGSNDVAPQGGGVGPSSGPPHFTFLSNRGANYNGTTGCGGAEGGGAGGAGEASGRGGKGYLWPVSNMTYAVGGDGGCLVTGGPSAGQRNTGNGGQGARQGTFQDGGAGGSGIVILALT